MHLTVTSYVLANTAATAGLVVMVAVRKVRRDRRERRHGSNQDHLRAALLSGGDDLDRLFRRAVGRAAYQADLAVVLPRVSSTDPDWIIGRARVHAERTGLARRLRRRLQSRRPAVRGTAAALIGHLRLKDGPALVGPLLRDRDGDVRLAAAGALARFGTGEAASALIEALAAGGMPEERIIERLGHQWATPTILTSLQATGAEAMRLRAPLARALGLAKDGRAEPTLLALLAHGDIEQRVCAARALATCGSDHSRLALQHCLADDSWEVRAQAASSLACLGAVEAVPDLAANLTHRAWWVRANAANALARLGTPGITALEDAAAGDDPYASERASETLALVPPAQRGVA
ncbi:MAG: HEAT repeat domain-containing protein [Acidobacteria bacterium]|nr:HEAT repeat domain-containing protein [Acidobacteriota bacterium]